MSQSVSLPTSMSTPLLQTAAQVNTEYKELAEDKNFSAPNYGHFGYDAMWVAALALHVSQIRMQAQTPPRSLLYFNYNESEMTDVFWQSMLELDFIGATVCI